MPHTPRNFGDLVLVEGQHYGLVLRDDGGPEIAVAVGNGLARDVPRIGVQVVPLSPSDATHNFAEWLKAPADWQVRPLRRAE